jgi:hypothetical protein
VVASCRCCLTSLLVKKGVLSVLFENPISSRISSSPENTAQENRANTTFGRPGNTIEKAWIVAATMAQAMTRIDGGCAPGVRESCM